MRSHRSALATATSGTAIVGLVATFAVVSSGFSAQRMDLGDGSVWVASERHQAIGRANTEVLELNSVIKSTSSRPSIVQHGRTVLIVDEERANVEIVDPVTSSVVDTVAIPPVDPAVSLAGSNVVVASAGDVWTVPVESFSDFDGASDPHVTFGVGSVTSIDPVGRLFALTPSTGTVSLVDVPAGPTVRRTWTIDPSDSGNLQITSVGGRFAVLDADSLVLTYDGGTVDLNGVMEPASLPVLQEPSADGESILIAHRGGLVSVGISGGEPRVLVAEPLGNPIAPIDVAECAYTAWSDGSLWRQCESDSPVVTTIADVPPSPTLRFDVNADAVVLNDSRSGRSWAVSDDNDIIDNWDQLIESTRNEETIERNDDENPPVLDRTQRPPVAVDDEFGARPGRTSILPVLLNDYDPNGDVLVIESVELPSDTDAHVDLISRNQQLQLSVLDDASGTLSFRYTINDGRGATASATVTVTIRGEDENSPPRQVRATTASVESGGRVSVEVLGDWVDPDGDPVYLASTTAQEPDAVTHTPSGRVVFTEAGGVGPERLIGLHVSDGRETSAGALEIAVRPRGSVPLTAEPFVVLAYADQEVRVTPLRHVRGGSGEVRLTAVPVKPGVSIIPDFDRGSFRFSSANVGTHYLDYTVTDGDRTANGVVRVDVSAPPEIDVTPITVPHTAFLRVQQPGDVDVLATDIDPTGGVLLVTGVYSVPEESGLRVEIIEQRLLRVTLAKPLESGPVSFSYRVSNGLADAEGSVTVIEIPVPSQKQAPIAVDDVVSVRVGDVIDVPVLENDSHPDGDALALAPDLSAGLPDGAGLLFASGNRLRYLAPDRPGNVTAEYRVDAPDGQFATATVKIAVREVDPDTNAAPVPATVTARVLAGDTVRIRIPLSGIDPDGDSVQFLGQETAPERGVVVATGQNWIDYEAGQYSSGTDTFEYAVVDSLGSRASGTIRVGIAERLDGGRNPVAVEDTVLTRPGTTVAVRVLENDSDPDGSMLHIVAVEQLSPDATAVVDEDVVRVTVPGQEGRFGFIYEVQNEHGGSGSTFLTVESRSDAPLARPEASDVVLSLSDVISNRTVDVDVLASVFFADGDVALLDVDIVDGYRARATVLADQRIRIEVADTRSIIPFTVARSDDPSVRGTAFIWVPGLDDALPQLRSDVPRIRVPSEQAIDIDINDYVVAVGGRSVRITDSATVRASHSDGGDLVVDADTIRFRSAQGYFGPASVSFTVTDGVSADDPDARTATIVLPIDVTPRQNQPPVVVGGLIEFEPGQTKTIDLVRLTNYPYPEDRDDLVYRVLDPRPESFDVAIHDQQLVITAKTSARKGTQDSVMVGVRDDANTGRSGRIDVRVVPSTKPIAQPVPDVHIAPRGETTVVDVLSNDEPGNPFPETPLRVVAVRGLDADTLPDGVSVSPSPDYASLTVRVSEAAVPGNTTLQYQVADATEDPSRFAWGTVTISVQDRPDPVSELRVIGFSDERLNVSFTPGSFNNSPIVGFEITLAGNDSGEIVGSTQCVATTCEIATPGNGEANAVIVRVAARNGIGLSDLVAAEGAVWSDVVPPAPESLAAEPLDGGLRISWDPVGSIGGGTAVRSYVVIVAGEASEVPAGSVCTANRCALVQGGLVNGSHVPFTVSARNEAYPALSTWNASAGAGVPFGPPIASGIQAVPDAEAGSVTVVWDAFNSNGDPVKEYIVQRLAAEQVPEGAQSCSVSQPAPGSPSRPEPGGIVAEQRRVGADQTSSVFEGLREENAAYSFIVWGWNGAGCVNTAVVSATPRPAPGGVTPTIDAMTWNGDTWNRRVTGHSGGAFRYELVAVDANGAELAAPIPFATGWVTNVLDRPFGDVVRFKIRGCTIWGSCGPWSSVYPGDPQPSLDVSLDSRRWDAGALRWSWTEDVGARNGGVDVEYRCGVAGDDAGVVAQTPTSCAPPGASDSTSVWLRVSIGDIARQYTN